MPIVSVIIPTYNRREYVQEAIDSVLAQTFTDYEIIVIDDGSTDGTGEALRARYRDRIHYEWQENQGESVARNRGIELAKGKYIAFLDSDDRWLPEKLEKQVAYLDEHPGVGMVVCQAVVIDSDGHPLASVPMLASNLAPEDLSLGALSIRCTIGNTSMVMCRQCTLSTVGGFDPEIRYGEDWDLYIRVSAWTRIAQIAEALSCTRYHDSNQWRLVKRELLAPTLEDHLRILSRAYAILPEGMDLSSRRAKAEARVYRKCAIAALAWGEYERGIEWLASARSRDPQALEHAGVDYANHLAAIHELSQRTDSRCVCAKLARTLQILGQTSLDSCERRLFRRDALACLFFISSRQSSRELIRYIFPRLLVSASGYVTNLGVWSLWFSSLVGEPWADRVKALLRRLGIHRIMVRRAS